MVHLDIHATPKSVQPVLAIAKKAVRLSPSLAAVAPKLVAVLILAYYYGGLVLAALLEEGQQTAPVLVHSEHLLPVVVSHVRRQLGTEVADLQVTQDGRGVRHLWHVLDHV